MDKCAEAQISFGKQRNAAVMGMVLEGRRRKFICESMWFKVGVFLGFFFSTEANHNRLAKVS